MTGVKTAPALFVCHGCGAVVDPALAVPFACPGARSGDDFDHVLVAPIEAADLANNGDDPFLRYRRWLSPYRIARGAGLSDAAWFDVVGELDEALKAVDGRGFRRTPFARQPALAAALGLSGPLWIKDETQNVSGSHKGRHLMGVMLYLRVLQISRLPLGADLRARRLAIASCGNAALAAAVVARAADWPIDVFIPADAEQSVVRRLRDLGANVEVRLRRPGESGDPCVRAARSAVARGAIPFGVQGPDNGLAVEGARTLAFEMAETLAAERQRSTPSMFRWAAGRWRAHSRKGLRSPPRPGCCRASRASSRCRPRAAPRWRAPGSGSTGSRSARRRATARASCSPGTAFP